jgi:hypothetical protein
MELIVTTQLVIDVRTQVESVSVHFSATRAARNQITRLAGRCVALRWRRKLVQISRRLFELRVILQRGHVDPLHPPKSRFQLPLTLEIGFNRRASLGVDLP